MLNEDYLTLTIGKQKKIALKRIQNKLGRLSIFAIIAQVIFLSTSYTSFSLYKPVLKNKSLPPYLSDKITDEQHKFEEDGGKEPS